MLAGSSDSIDPEVEKRLRDLLSHGVARAAADVHPAVIFDCGRANSVAALMGQGVADRGRRSQLVGVAPVPDVSERSQMSNGHGVEVGALALDHSHFVMVRSQYPADATALMIGMADALSQDSAGGAKSLPVVGVLTGGRDDEGDRALEEVLAIVRHGWPLFVLEGTGPLPDQIAGLVTQQHRKARRQESGFWSMLAGLPLLHGLTHFEAPSPELQEIIEDGRLTVVSREQNGSNLRSQLARSLVKPPPESVLLLAWRRFSEYDLNAGRHQKRFVHLKDRALKLGVASTVVALVYSAPPGQFAAQLAWLQGDTASDPSADHDRTADRVSLFLALETRFKAGSKYILLREAAEAVKRGIYSYRVVSQLSPIPPPAGANTQANPTTPDLAGDRLPATPDALAKYLATIGRRLMTTDVKEAALEPYSGPLPPPMYAAEARDDAVSPLTGDEYVKIRVGDQIQFYSRKTNAMERKLRNLQVLILVFGALGAFLAAIEWQYWLPITAALVTALTAFIEYRQFEQILVKYNFTKSALEDLRSWWRSLSDEERTAGTPAADANIRRLVRETEAVLESEISGWVQYLKEATTQKQATAPGSGADGAPPPQDQQ